jgi:predicted 3-demethylubiquinone-9 3-methyltransferase (glyoxalase superfamily)
MQKITTFFWFENQAEEAANFYCSVFKDSKITGISRNGDEGPGPKGSPLVVTFELNGQEFMALNGGPEFKFTEAISLLVQCENQEQVDHYWSKLSEGGQEIQCGWLKDKYGLCWQIVPRAFMQMMQDKDRAKTDRVLKAMMQMIKFDIAALEKAYRGE